ncbi:MAG TPA: hypothetical protein VHX86_08175 [Tepidisphaeraceae bacterium]|jgi:hypothetical protein|nr:hypothetical protein [Tepidisphaeraceae bacterium]
MGVYGCGEALTFSQDSKREGIREYSDGRYAQATGSFRNAIRQNPAEAEYWLGMSGGDSHGALDLG